MSSKVALISFFFVSILSYWSIESIDDQLILFVSKQNTAVNQQYLEKFKAFAEKNETQPVIKYIEDSGAPKMIAVTPSVVFINEKGHSTYYGRYRNFSRMKTFLRKSRLKHSQNSLTKKAEILVWENQRASITAPLKITKITGTLPADFDQKTFYETAKNCFNKGMTNFQLLPAFDQPKNNRAFYLDIHPHLSEDKTLTLTGEIYSQFNCIRAVYSSMRSPIIQGKWKNRRQLLETVASLMEAEILKTIKASEKGDDFVPVPLSTKEGDLKFDLAQSVVKRNNTPISTTIPTHWQVKQQINHKEPVGAFSFLSPLDGYAGEIKQLNGILSLGNDNSLSGIGQGLGEGTFTVAIKDISMGEESFDNEVQNKMLNQKQFPISTFKFKLFADLHKELTLYREKQITVNGTFTLKGYEIPVTVPATMELRLDKEGNYLLHTVATFSLNLFQDFKVEGPDGPSPAKDILEFVLKFDLEEKAD